MTDAGTEQRLFKLLCERKKNLKVHIYSIYTYIYKMLIVAQCVFCFTKISGEQCWELMQMCFLFRVFFFFFYVWDNKKKMFSITGQTKNKTHRKAQKNKPSTTDIPKQTNRNRTNADNGVDSISNKDRAITVVSFSFSVHFCQSQYCSLDLI